MMKKYTSSVVAEFMSHYILGDEEVRFVVTKVCFNLQSDKFMGEKIYACNFYLQTRSSIVY